MSQNIKEIRHFLHAHPELSGKEVQTHDLIVDFLEKHHPNRLVQHVGGNGVVALFAGKQAGKTIAIRGDIDALPITEQTDLIYRSVNDGVGHKCGHDGHTAILLQLVENLSQYPLEKGSVVLIFQPEEETGYGAAKMIQSGVLEQFNIDFIFGLHNLPAFALGNIVVKIGTFAAASSGMIIRWQGRETHAAHPENGINPSMAVAEWIQWLDALNKKHHQNDDFQQATLIYTRIGKVAFGTSAGDAEVMMTLRAFSNILMQNLVNQAITHLSEISKKYGLTFSYTFQDEFLAVENNDICVKKVEQAAKNIGFETTKLPLPFRWSEDFSHYLSHYQGAFFGIGSGETTKELHHPDYDFPDALIEKGAAIFRQIIHENV
ncbi:MAG: amidohydrolase [Bacteroidales bacterium]|nr:amidohydrolase [Bacteroidales bacterium]